MKYLLTLLIICFSSIAYANSNSSFTVGLGVAGGVQSVNTNYKGTFEAKARLRALKWFGFEASYGRFDYRLAGLFYIPTFPVGAFLKFAAGARDFDHVNFKAVDSYSVGLGVDWFTGDHMAFGLEGAADLGTYRLKLIVSLMCYL